MCCDKDSRGGEEVSVSTRDVISGVTSSYLNNCNGKVKKNLLCFSAESKNLYKKIVLEAGLEPGRLKRRSSSVATLSYLALITTMSRWLIRCGQCESAGRGRWTGVQLTFTFRLYG